MMTPLQYLIFSLFVLILSSSVVYAILSRRLTPIAFYFSLLYLILVVASLVFSSPISYFLNTILSLPDARISVLFILIFISSLIIIYLLSFCSDLQSRLLKLNREVAFLSHKISEL